MALKEKLIPRSSGILHMFSYKVFNSTSRVKSRFYFSNSNPLLCSKYSYFGFQTNTTKPLVGHAPFASGFVKEPKEDVFKELKRRMKNGLLRKNDIDNVIKKESAYYQLDNSLLILQCINKLPDITPENRVVLAENFFNKLKDIGCVTEAHSLQVLQCYLQSDYFTNLDSFLSEMKVGNANISEELQSMILKCLSRKKSMKDVDTVVPKKKNEGNVGNVEESHAAAIYNLAVSDGVNKAYEELKKLKENSDQVGNATYTSLLKAIALTGDKSYMADVTRDALLDGIVFSEDQMYSILENVVISKHYDLISDVKMLCVDELFLKISQNMLVKLLRSGNIEIAFDFINYVLSLQYVCESSDQQLLLNGMCKSFIEELCHTNCPVEDVIDKCKKLKKLNMCLYSLEYGLHYYLKNRDVGKSFMILQAMYDFDTPIEAHYFWPILIIMAKKFGNEGILFVLDKMIELNILINAETWVGYVFPYMSDIWFAKKILEQLDFTEAQRQLFTEAFVLYTIITKRYKEGLKFVESNPLYNGRSYKFFEKYLERAILENPDNEEIIILAKKIGDFDPHQVISRMLEQDRFREMKQLLKYLAKHQLCIRDSQDIDYYLEVKVTDKNLRLAISNLIDNSNSGDKRDRKSGDPRKPSRFEEFLEIERAEVILAELEAKNLNTVGQRLRLLKYYIETQLYDKAVKIKNELLELMSSNPDFSPGYLIQLSRLAAYEGDTDKALQYFNLLLEKAPFFKVGCVAGLSLCVNFIHHRCYNEMLNVLRVLPKWDGSTENVMLRPVQLLREVSKLGMPELTDVVFKILLQKKLVGINANTLQAYTKTYIHANDLDGAVEEYMKILREHNIISNSISIMWAAAENNRFDIVDKIAELCIAKYKNKIILVSAFPMIAMTGDPEFLLSYSKKYDLALDDPLVITKFSTGNIPVCPPKSFKTLTTAAMSVNVAYNHFIVAAVENIRSQRAYDEAEDFLNFCKSNQIELDLDCVETLKKFCELRKLVTTESHPKRSYAAIKRRINERVFSSFL